MDNTTHIHYNREPTENYDYLFRNWRNLLEKATKTNNIWINDFENKRKMIKKLHYRTNNFGLTEEEKQRYSDDLPNFLLKLNSSDLEDLLSNIESNLVDKSEANCRMYTIHAYKGMENNNIRIHNDVKLTERNLYYVALTRGKKNIYVDKEEEEEVVVETKTPGIVIRINTEVAEV